MDLIILIFQNKKCLKLNLVAVILILENIFQMKQKKKYQSQTWESIIIIMVLSDPQRQDIKCQSLKRNQLLCVVMER